MYSSGMNKQRNMPEKRCCCFSFPVGCIIIGLLEIFDIMFQKLLLESTGSSALIIFSYLKIAIDVLVAALVIFGSLKQNRLCLWAWVIINISRVLAFPLFFCLYGYYALFVVERRPTPNDPIGVGVFFGEAAIIISMSFTHALCTFVVYGYIRVLRQQQHHYYTKGASAGAEFSSSLK